MGRQGQILATVTFSSAQCVFRGIDCGDEVMARPWLRRGLGLIVLVGFVIGLAIGCLVVLDWHVERLRQAGNYAEAATIIERQLAFVEWAFGPENGPVANGLNELA